MSSEEQKERPGQEEEALPPAQPESAEAAEEAVEEEPQTGAEKKEKKFWPIALALMLLVLAGGGYYALTGLGETAHKLGGGSDYDRLSANSEVYDGSAGRGARGADSFPLDEEAARKAAYRPGGDARQDRMNPSVIRGKGELAADASGASGAAPDIPQPLEDVHESKGAPQEQPQAGEMGEKLKAKAYFSTGPGARGKSAAAGRNVAAFEGAGALAGKGSLQRETGQGKPKQAAKGGVLDSLKGAFRATFYGARLSSQDSARSWVSRAFDATPESGTAIEYDEKMRNNLDRVNPDSIPQFLRDQDVTSAEAKRLAVSDPGKPKLDKDGTYDALQKDKAYQQQKLASDFGSSMLNGMFAGLSGGGPQTDPEVFSDPDDQSDFNSLGLGEYLQSQGNGESCGCSAAAPCCCLPQNYFQQSNNCPAYGPFLPNDPCGAAIYGGNAGMAGATVSP